MKKLILFILLVISLKVSAQQTFWTPGVPPGSTSFSPSFRFIGTDSLANIYFSNGTKWWLGYTATQQNLRFLTYTNLNNANHDVTGNWSFNKNGLGTTTSNVLSIKNSTAATLSVKQVSPAIRFSGNAFITGSSTSATSDFDIYNAPINGTSSITGILTVASAGNPLFQLTDKGGGTLTTGGNTTQRIIVNGTNNAASGTGRAINVTSDIGPTANGDALTGLDVNATFSTGTAVATLGGLPSGTGGTDGTYTGVTLIDNTNLSTGVAAVGTFTVSGGTVTAVTITNGGARHAFGNVITAKSSDIGGVTGFTSTVATTASYTGAVKNQILAHGVSGYDADHSSDYTARSWIDKGYADATYAPVSGAGYIPYSDSAHYQTVQNFFPKGDPRWLRKADSNTTSRNYITRYFFDHNQGIRQKTYIDSLNASIFSQGHTYTAQQFFNAGIYLNGTNLDMAGGVILNTGEIDISDAFGDPTKLVQIRNYSAGWSLYNTSTHSGVSFDPVTNRLYTQGTAGAGSGISYVLGAGTSGQYIKGDGTYGTYAGGGGTVTNVSSANTDINVTTGSTTPVLTLNNVNGVTKTYYDPTSSIQTQLNSKQASLGFTAENVANKKTTLTNSATDYPSTGAVKAVTDANYTAIGLKQPRILPSFTPSSAGVIASGDSVQRALEKAQYQINTNTAAIATKGSGTVISFGKVDGIGIISSVANSTTTPVHTVTLDTAYARGLSQQQITTLAGRIATNTANISTNTSNISTNTTAISGKAPTFTVTTPLTYTSNVIAVNQARQDSIINAANIIWWGDSLFQSLNNDYGIVSQYSNLTGQTTINQGIAGQTSSQILTRYNASTGTQGYATIWGAGRNNFTDTATVVANAISFRNAQATAGNNRYLVFGVIKKRDVTEYTGTTNANLINYINTRFAAIFKGRFVNADSLLYANYNAAIPQDVIDHTHGVPPFSLHAVNDSLHLNKAGYALEAAFINTTFYRGVLQSKLNSVLTVVDAPALSPKVPNTLNVNTGGQYLIGGAQVLRLFDQSISNGNFVGGTGLTSPSFSGTKDVGFSVNSMVNATTAHDNTWLGWGTLSNTVTGNASVAIGSGALAAGDNTNSIAIGANAGTNLSGSRTNNIAICTGCSFQSATGDGQMTIANAIFGLNNTAQSTTISTGNIGIFQPTPTARLHIAAGAASAGKAPLKIDAGTNLSTTEAGAIENDGTHLYYTAANAGTRYQLDQQTGALYTAGRGTTLTSGTFGLDTTQNYTWGKVQTFLKGISLSGNQTIPAWGENGPLINIPASTLTDNSTSGTATFNMASSFGVPTLVATNAATTYTAAGTVEIQGAPIAGTNVTIGSPYALYVKSGFSAFVGGFQTGSGVNSNMYLQGANTASSTNNAAAKFGGGSSSNFRALFNGSSSSTVTAGFTYANVLVGASPATTAATGTINVLSNMTVKGMGTVTSGGATVTETDAFRVEGTGTATGGVNYALRALNGVNRLDSIQVKNMNLNASYGTAGQVATSQGSSSAMTWSNVPINQASANLTAQTTAGNITTFTVGASTATFNVSAYINVTAVATDVIQAQVTYTDENSTSQTVSFTTLSTVSNSTYSPVTIRAKTGSVITLKTNLTTGVGSITFDAGGSIIQN